MIRAACLALGLLLAAAPAWAAGTLRYALEFDPDVLDPARNGSYTDRIVFSSMCEQLLDIDEKLNYVPRLATAWEWSPDNLALTVHLRPGVVYQDGEKLTAASVVANLDRDRTAPESIRKAELQPVVGEDVLDPLTLRIRLATPYAPLLSLLANRPGTPLSPRILGLTPDQIAAHPVCAGPFAFVSRTMQDRIVLERFPGYWDAASISLDRIEFRTITSSTVRLVNLQAGALDMVNRLSPTDAGAVAADPKLALATSPSLGYQLITFNTHHGPAADSPIGRDPLVREAFEKSIDRAALNQAVFDGRYVPSNQMEAPGSRYWNPAHPVPPRDLAGAKALLAQAGLTRVPVTLQLGTDPLDGQVAQVIQSMADEAGFDVKIEQEETVALGAATRAGQFQASMGIWSGRPDPDGNAAIWLACDGFVNRGQYCNPRLDALLRQAASTIDPAARVPLYRQITDIYLADRPYMVLFHFTWLWGLSRKVEGFRPMPDGLMRPQGLRLLP